jgi:hypothetical protein
MKRFLVLILFVLLLFQICHAQSSLYSTRFDSLITDDQDYVPDPALVNKFNPRKSLLIPIAESIGLNLALGAFNCYVVDSEFAKIGWKTVKHNHEIGWTTDADALLTNMFAHPFHGSIYFNTARSSGYNYWTSWGVAMVGSWQWEFFMENEPPALNDWIMTSMAGSMLGEIFYRFSNLILDESLSGSSRTWNEIGAGIFNPGRLFNRLIYGHTARVTTEKLYEKRLFLGELGLGINNVAEGTDFENGQKNGMFTVDFAYGKLFDKRGGFKPFDFFRWNLAVNFGGVQPPIGQFRIYSLLAGKATRYDNGSAFLWGFFNNYDFLENNVYEIGGVSIGPGIGYSTPPKKYRFLIQPEHTIWAPALMSGWKPSYAGHGVHYTWVIVSGGSIPGMGLRGMNISGCGRRNSEFMFMDDGFSGWNIFYTIEKENMTIIQTSVREIMNSACLSAMPSSKM